MRGKKAKAFRVLAGYHPHRDYLSPPEGSFTPETVVLPKHSNRKVYKFIKRRYGMIPVGMALQRLRDGLAMIGGQGVGG